MRIRPARRSRPAPRAHRARRSVAVLVLTALALMLTTQQAMAEGLELDTVSVSLPSLSSLASWFEDPHWGKTPHQQSGTAAGHKHHVSAKATDAKRGVGKARGKGKGELAAYHAHKPAVQHGKSQGGPGYNAKTSKRNAAKSSRTDTVFDNADGSTTRRISPKTVNYQVRKGRWAPIDVDVRAGPDDRWYEKANSLAVDFGPKANDHELVSFAVDGTHSSRTP